VRVDNFEGVITQINARYTVVRSNAGRESIVPNEMLVVSRVENLSLVDSKVHQTTVVNVGYDSDVVLVSRLLVNAALAQERVLRDPEPAAYLSAFRGQINLRSDINLAILAALRENKIEIPFPQRVVYQR
jgi:small-conductance mechanosensitive channel